MAYSCVERGYYIGEWTGGDNGKRSTVNCFVVMVSFMADGLACRWQRTIIDTFCNWAS
jgi:hypothetical protein